MAIFVENYKKVDKSKFVNFFEFTLYMIFKNFQENRKNHIQGGFVKIRAFTLVIIFVFLPQTQQILEKKLEISQHWAYQNF